MHLGELVNVMDPDALIGQWRGRASSLYAMVRAADTTITIQAHPCFTYANSRTRLPVLPPFVSRCPVLCEQNEEFVMTRRKGLKPYRGQELTEAP